MNINTEAAQRTELSVRKTTTIQPLLGFATMAAFVLSLLTSSAQAATVTIPLRDFVIFSGGGLSTSGGNETEIGGHTLINGNIGSDQDLFLQGNPLPGYPAQLNGSAYAGGSIFFGQDLTNGSSSGPLREVVANGAASISGGADIYGNLYANDVTLGQDARIRQVGGVGGNVQYTTTYSPSGGGTPSVVEGTVSTPSTKTFGLSNMPPATVYTAGGANQTVATGQGNSLTLAPGTYGTLATSSQNQKVILSSGNYYFDSITSDGGFTNQIDLTSGNRVNIYVVGDVALAGRQTLMVKGAGTGGAFVRIDQAPQLASLIYMETHGRFTMTGGLDGTHNFWGGTLYASLLEATSAEISIGQYTDWYGAAWAYDSFDTADHGKWNYVPLACTLNLSETNVNVSCYGGTNGSIDLTVTGAAAPVTYSWSNGSTNQDLTGIPAGTYTVIVADGSGCRATNSVTITQPAAALTLSETHTNVACFGGNNGSINLSVSGGTSPYTFAWSNGATTEDLIGLAAGTYTVTVTDANGCTAGTSVTITQPATALVLSETHTNVACYGGNNASINLSVSGGTSPYTFAWNTGATTEDLSGLVAGTYTVTVTDANGCTAGTSVTITGPANPLVASAGINQTICSGGSATLNASATGGTAPYSFSWDQGLGSGATKTVSPTTNTTYTVTVTDTNGCQNSASVTVTVNNCATAALGDFVWQDLNGDGIQNTNEPGVSNVVVILMSCAGTPIATNLTDATGYYLFTGLAAGDYMVAFVPPYGTTFTLANAGSDDALESDANTTNGMTGCYTLAAGETNLTVDAGLVSGIAVCSPCEPAPANTPGQINRDLASYVLFAFEDLSWKGGNSAGRGYVSGGNVGLNREDEKPNDNTRYFNVGQNGRFIMSDNTHAVFDVGTVGDVANVYDIHWRTNLNLSPTAIVRGTNYRDFVPPIINITNNPTYGCPDLFPAFTASTNAADDITVPVNGTLGSLATPLAPGTYRDFTARDGSTVFFGPGTYTFRSWHLGTPTKIFTTPCTVIRVQGDTDPNSNDFNFGGNGSFLGSYATWQGSTNCADEAIAQFQLLVQAINFSDSGTFYGEILAPCSTSTGAGRGNTIYGRIISGEIHSDFNTDIFYRKFCCSTTPPPTTASLGNFVWNDLNQDGIQDGNEPGVSNVLAILRRCADDSQVASTNTDANGHYLFTGLQPGDYYVVFTNLPAGFVFSPANAGSDDALDSDANVVSGRSHCVTLVGGTTDLTVDAGIHLNCTLSLTETHVPVSCYGGNNGSIDLTVTGAAAPVTYSWSNGSTNQDLSGLVAGTYTVTVTDANGCRATNSVSITQPASALVASAGTDQTICSGGSATLSASATGGTTPYSFSWDQGLGSGATQTVSPTTNTTYTVTVTDTNGCQNSASVTVTVNPPATVNAGADQTICATEQATLGGVMGGGATSATWSSSGSGTFTPSPTTLNATYTPSSGDIAAGSVTLTLTTDDPAGPCGPASGSLILTIQPAILCAPAALGDFVWQDLNGDGIQNTNEPGVSNVVVILMSCAGTPIATNLTDATGYYLFTGLAAGDYKVTFVQPTNYVFTLANAGTNDLVDSDANTTNGMTGCYTLPAGETNLTVDAGLYLPASLGNFVWNDLNNDGIQNTNEPGVSNVLVTLYRCGSTDPVATTTTAANGSYAFTILAPGSYYVVFTLPNGYAFSPPDQGSDLTDSDANGSGQTACVTLNSGDNNTTVDAGLVCRGAPVVSKGSIGTCYTDLASAESAAKAATTAQSVCCPGPVTISASTVGTCSATITVTATDGCGNSASVTYSTRIDGTLPMITAAGTPANGILGCNPTAAAINAALGMATASDNCGPVTATPSDSAVSVNGCNRSQTRTWTSTDDCGNAATPVSRTVTWTEDTTPPVVTCPPDVNLPYSGSGSQAYCGYTQGGWGASPNGNNVGMLLRNNFTVVYTNGVEVGIPDSGGYSMKFTSAQAIEMYMPAGGTAGALTADAVNPISSAAGVFGGQVLALQLNVDFSKAGITANSSGPLGNLVLNDPASTLNGKTVSQILALANIALGGGNAGVSIAVLNSLVTSLNEAFDNCVANAWAVTYLLPAAQPPDTSPAKTGFATATDNCGLNGAVTYSDSTAPGSCPDGYVITRTWRATDNCGNIGSCNQIIRVGCGSSPLILGCVPVSAGEVGLAYNSSLTASGGTLPYTFSIIAGSLPGGLVLNPTTGMISGTPTTAGTFFFTAQVVDATSGTALTDTVNCSISIAPTQTGGCTLTIGYYKNHPSSILPLPIYLGTPGGAKTLVVSSQQIGVDVLGQHFYGAPANGITKLYAQLLAAKLNGLHGASQSAVSATISSADAFLARIFHSLVRVGPWGGLRI